MNKKKRDLQAESGINNGPASRQYPVLTYKYVMNEPFVGGTNAQIQMST